MRIPIQAVPIFRVNVGTRDFSGRSFGISAQDACSTCESILTTVVQGAAKAGCWAGCYGVAAVVETACCAAVGGPEDPLCETACVALSAATKLACNKFGCDNLKTHAGAAAVAKAACTTAGVC